MAASTPSAPAQNWVALITNWKWAKMTESWIEQFPHVVVFFLNHVKWYQVLISRWLMIFLCGLTSLPFIFHLCDHLYWHRSHVSWSLLLAMREGSRNIGQRREGGDGARVLRAEGRWGGGGVRGCDRGWQSMVLCSMSPRDATCLLSCFVTPCPAASQATQAQQGCGAEDGLNVPWVNV